MATAYLTRTPGSAGDRKTWTLSGWYKRSANASDYLLSSGQYSSTQLSQILFEGDDYFNVAFYSSGAALEGHLETNRKFRDPAAWYHIVVAMDTTQAVAADRLKIYVNGVQETSFKTETYPAEDYEPSINNNVAQNIGRREGSGFFNGVMAHVHFTDGTAYAASDFGETDSTSGIWVAKTSPSVTYGTNGYFLKFQDTSAFGDDSSGNNNDFTMSGTITQTKDTPDDNFCTMNPLSAGVINGAGMPLTNGNTTIYDGDANWRSAFGTIGDNQGKYYFEAKMVGSSTNWWIGFLDARQVVKGEYKFTAKTRGYGVSGAGNKGNSDTEVSWGVSYAQNDIAMCALDLDNGKIYFGKNGTWSESGDPTSGSTGTGAAYSVTTDYIYLPAVGLYDTTAGMSLNFGNGYFGTTAVSSAGTNASGIGTFEYDVPTGYTAVSTLGFME